MPSIITGNGTISALDASQILQFVVGIISDFGIERDWTFLPERRDFPVLDADHTDQDFTGVLFGDVSGNWGESNNPKGVGDGLDWIDIAEGSGAPGEIIRVPVTLKIPGDIVAADFDVTYNPDVLTAMYATTTDLTSEYILEHKATEGRMRVAMAGVEPIDRSGEFVEIVFQVSPHAELGETYPVELNVRLNETRLPSIVSSVTAAAAAPTTYGLSQNYPNPFNPITTIHYALPDAGRKTQDTRQNSSLTPNFLSHVSLKVYNMLGQEVRTLVDEEKKPGYYTVTWDGTNENGNEIPSGVYFYRLEVGDFSATKRMILMK